MQIQENESSQRPRIVRGRVDSLSLYEITDYELQTLEEGSIGATYLNFAVFFISVAASFLTNLLTAPLSGRVFTVFVVVVVVGFSLGGVLLVLWHRTRVQMTRVIQKIKDRCVPPSALTSSVVQVDSHEDEASAG